MVIVDFCKACGVVLLSDAHDAGNCLNCGHDVLPRENRIQGTFEESEASALFAACSGEGQE